MAEDQKHNPVVEGARTVLGVAARTIAVWVGVVLLFALVFGIGLWLFSLFT